MDCIEFNKSIAAFMDDSLGDAELNAFLNHLKTCKSCAEELEVDFIVYEGISRLDDKNASLNLASAHEHKIVINREYISSRKKLINLSNVFRTLTFWTIVCAAFVFLRIMILGG